MTLNPCFPALPCPVGRLTNVSTERQSGTFRRPVGSRWRETILKRVSSLEEASMHGVIYIIGLIVVVLFVLSFLGLR
jgi:hypothetical protein